jgi:hypothetical protein
LQVHKHFGCTSANASVAGKKASVATNCNSRRTSVASPQALQLQLRKHFCCSHKVRRCGNYPYCKVTCRPIVAPVGPRGAPVVALVGELVVLPTGSRAHHRPTRGRPLVALRRCCYLGSKTQKNQSPLR